MTDIEITQGLPEQHRTKAARLYYSAFRQKLHPIFRNEARGLAVLEESLNGEKALVAIRDGDLVGIAGFNDKTGSLVDIRPATMVEMFGWVGGWVRLFALMLFTRHSDDQILLMDGIVVDPAQRGGGIGSQLLDAMIDYAQSRGYDQVRLDVVDTNPRARQLYERKGFVAVDETKYPVLKRIFGFSASTTMLRKV